MRFGVGMKVCVLGVPFDFVLFGGLMFEIFDRMPLGVAMLVAYLDLGPCLKD